MIAVYVICGLILTAIIMYIRFKINDNLQMCIRKYSTLRKNGESVHNTTRKSCYLNYF